MAKNSQSIPRVVIFGSTNVGKSTLFNCLVERYQALISNIEGTTRDSIFGTVSWQGKKFTLIDTGGIMDVNFLSRKKLKVKETDINALVQKQACEHIIQADLILFLVDIRHGLLLPDKQMALKLKKLFSDTAHIILVANKADSPRLRREVAEFNKLGLGRPLPISATTGSGTGDLLDLIVKQLNIPQKNKKEQEEPEESQPIINVCLVGKPNAGKSSLINKLIGKERQLVSSIPHTTREPQDIAFEYKGKIINFIDTAGISKKGQKSVKKRHAKKALEKLSIAKSLRSLKFADIALLILDINEKLTHQDSKIVEEIINSKTSLIIVANKWDLIKNRDTKEFTKYIRSELPFVVWAPIQFTSALTGEKALKLFDVISETYDQRLITIRENPLNKFLGRLIKIHKPAKAKGTKRPHIYELKQISSNPPRFMIRIGAKDTINFSYVRFIENRLREKFGFVGAPINIIVEHNLRIHGQHEKSEIAKTKKSVKLK